MKGNRIRLFGLEISGKSFKETLRKIILRAKNKKGGRVYCCTLNEMMMADEDKKFKKILEKGNILTADGMPLVWLLRFKGIKAERVYGPDLLGEFLKLNEKEKLKCAFVGNAQNKEYFNRFGEYVVAPMKRVFNKDDVKKIGEKIRKSGADLVWVSLGAKKQIEVSSVLAEELPNKVFITVGAAFDFLSEVKKQAPKWIRNHGGEWMFRLANEPNRLGKRYFKIGLYLSRKICLVGKKIVNKIEH
jgi:N-acetylglucosaminyldiphosphoundecaprenol N-acetyl-beta-D-mannosaminyltransferase